MLRTYRTCNSTVEFSKYKFYNKLLGGVILLRVTLGVTLSNVTPLSLFELDANFDKSIVRLYYLRIFSMLAKFQSDQKLIVMSSINYLNSSFCNLK